MNVDISCPQCGTLYTIRRELLGRRSKCAKCGVAFVLSEPVPNTSSPIINAPEVSSQEFVPAPQIAVRPAASSQVPLPKTTRDENKPAAPSYWALRMIARSYEVFAVISAVGSMIPLALFIHAAIEWPSLMWLSLVRFGLPIIILLLSAVMFLFLAQVIRLILQLEQNTRESADACSRLAEHLCAVEGEV